ncbi:uncharacterized protein N7459_008287 [Penicillium hispanicum]|uniref:uncharacterized protein n=1 Tax=Penicillium hispanicum TaxID=1080232 RepID=UPI00253F901D|nr:uncharacterized protein N7459_008287 [Penicillium hispanicum]KAJ5573860.1 hypothetical protein N7459_008287 [Penicillium hispanicum]
MRPPLICLIYHLLIWSIYSLKASLEGPQSKYHNVLVNIVFDLRTLDESVYSALTQSARITGGDGGNGSRGSEENGADGQPAQDGTYKLQSATDMDATWSSTLCFAHPVQCRMLLDMAKLYFFIDGLDDLAKCKELLERLISRLAFLDSQPASKASLSTNLVKAYRDAEPRLFIPSGSDTEEPASLQTKSSLALLNSGKDFYGYDRNRVPRASFKSFEQTIDKELDAVKSAETTYTAYLQAANDAAKKRDYINHSRAACESAKESNNVTIKAAKDDIADYIIKIRSFTKPMKAASESLRDAARDIMLEIKSGVHVPAVELFESIGQIIMVPGISKVPMAALQGVSLLHQGLEEIPNDAGMQVNKDYLIKQVRNISGTMDSLYEGYKVSKSGQIDLLDPGAAKLQIAEEQLKALLGEFENALPADTLAKFEDLVIKRNSAVLRYNAALVVIAKAVTENAALYQTQSNISQMEKVSFGMDNPMMVVAMKSAYLTAVKDLQYWLYHAQRAYNFAALNLDNILASYFNSVDTSQYTYANLKVAQRMLIDAHSRHIAAQRKAADPFHTIQYVLEEGDFRALKASSTDGTSHSISIPTPDKDNRRSPFTDMTDIRLTRVRLFLPGAKTKNGLLHMKLTHMGDETIADPKDREMAFVHDTVSVLFKYNLLTNQYKGPGTLPGIIGHLNDKDDYSLVGPFAEWTIDLEKESNEDLDLSDITSAYMEFEGSYQPKVV